MDGGAHPKMKMAEAQWVLDCGGRRQKAERIKPGLYRIHWITGDPSLAAIGCGSNGDNWVAPINWIRPDTVPELEGSVWGVVKSLELIAADDATPKEASE